MTNEELLIVNLAQKKAMGIMANDIGDRLSRGEEIPDLMLNLKAAEQLTKLFLREYGQVTPDASLLTRLVFVIQGLLNNYVLEGVHVFDQTQSAPAQPTSVELIVQGNGDGTQAPTIALNYTLKLKPSDFYGSYVYADMGLYGIDYELDITGGATLRKGIDYTVFPRGGFQLINGITLASTDLIILRAFSGFVSIPTPGATFASLNLT